MAGYSLNIEPLPTVEPIGAPGNDFEHIQATPEMFGANIARSLGALGQGVEKASSEGFEVATQVAQFQGRVNVDDQANKWIDTRNRILYGDPNKTVIGLDGKPTQDRGYFGLEGRSATDQRAAIMQQLQEARQAGLKNLTTPAERFAYETSTRRMYADAETEISRHAEGQWKVWAGGVSNAGAAHELNEFLNSLDDPEKATDHIHHYIGFKVQEAQLKYGNDPQIAEQAEAKAKLELLEAQVNMVAVKDPARAIEILNSNKKTAGVRYDDIYNHLRTRAETQTGVAKANQYVAMATGAGGGAMVAASKREVAGSVASAWRGQGMSDNGVAGILFNIGEESSFNPTLRHPDQPRFAPSDERHYAHGLYQEGAEEWSRYESWIAANHRGADWRDPKLQSEFAAWNLKTNYPGTWTRMNAAATPEEAAGIYAREYLRPSAENLQSRITKIGGGIAPIGTYGAEGGSSAPGGGTAAAVYTPTGAVAPSVAPGVIAPGQPQLAERLGAALRAAIADPDMNDHERDIAVRAIESQFRVLEITENQNTKAKKEANDNAASELITTMANGLHTPNFDWVKLQGQIARSGTANGGPLTWETQQHLLDRVAKFSGEEERIGYGTGFFDAKARIMSPPGTPGHIGSIEDILSLPPASITRQGEHELVSTFNLMKREDQGALQEAKHGAEAAIKLKLVRPEDMGGFIKDIKGEQAFNGRFLPMFNSAYNEWVKAGKNPYDFLLDQKKIDDIAERAYPKKDRDRDAVFGKDKAGEANEPLPPTPAAINPAGWVPIVGAPPMTSKGQPWPLANWAQVLQKLHDDPSEENKAAFNERFGKTGMTADKVLEKFKQSEGAAGAKSAIPAAAAAPVGSAPSAEFGPPSPYLPRSEGRGRRDMGTYFYDQVVAATHNYLQSKDWSKPAKPAQEDWADFLEWLKSVGPEGRAKRAVGPSLDHDAHSEWRNGR
jgi:Phage tail lysozyme